MSFLWTLKFLFIHKNFTSDKLRMHLCRALGVPQISLEVQTRSIVKHKREDWTSASSLLLDAPFSDILSTAIVVWEVIKHRERLCYQETLSFWFKWSRIFSAFHCCDIADKLHRIGWTTFGVSPIALTCTQFDKSFVFPSLSMKGNGRSNWLSEWQVLAVQLYIILIPLETS